MLTFGHSHSTAWVILLALLSVLAIVYVTFGIQDRSTRIRVLGLRIVMWLLVLILCLKPSWVKMRREMDRKSVAVFVDRSLSMSLPASGGKTRWDEVRILLSRRELWDQFQRDFDLQFYSFSDEAGSSTLESLRSISKPDGTVSAISKMVSIPRSPDQWAGLVLVSDGVDTSDSPRETEPKAQSGIPILTVYPSQPEGLRDLAIVDVRTPQVAYYQTRLSLEVDIERIGVSEGSIQLRAVSRGRILSEMQIESRQWDGNQATIPLSFSPNELGSVGITIEIQQIPNEITYENNRKGVVLNVLRDRVRVLHVAGRPTWDERFLRAYLKENSNIDLISFFILRSPTNNPGADQNALSLIPFPYQDLFTKELERFDLVIFQNFDFKTYFSSFYLANLRNYVEKGGAFVMIGGDLSFGQGGYRGTPIDEILPVRIRDDTMEISVTPFQPILTPQANHHPLSAGKIHPSDLKALPSLIGFHRVGELQENGVALFGHPSEKTAGKPAPILAVREVAQGRAAALLVDSLWRWAFAEDSDGPRLYRAVWDGLYRWLVRDPSFSHLKISIDEPLQEGREAKFRLKVLDDRYEAMVNTKPVVERMAANGERSQKLSIGRTDSEGEAHFSVLPEAPGLLELLAELPERGSGYRTAENFAVGPRSREFDRRGVDEAMLQKLAASTHGRAVPLSDVGPDLLRPLVDKATYHVVGQVEIPLWDQVWILGILVCVSGFEWWYRRKHGAP
ncbi:MAG TPA: glutamine amidotransferase [Bdellovibrionota bacterium]|nr:glutamine amidotransferase [Bdellovibrionota bacterium]